VSAFGAQHGIHAQRIAWWRNSLESASASTTTIDCADARDGADVIERLDRIHDERRTRRGL
jgi:hypothetical protein